MRAFFFLLCISLGLKGQSPSFKRLSEGLSHQHITSLLRSSDGLMWIGTPAGLHRYDGNSIRVSVYAAFDTLKAQKTTSGFARGPA